MRHHLDGQTPTHSGGRLGSPARQAFALWGGLLAWLFSFVAVWGISEIDCNSESFSLSILGVPSATFISLVIVALSAFTALGAAHVAASHVPDPDDPEDERPFVARFGVVLNGFFMIATLAGGLPFFLLRTCS